MDIFGPIISATTAVVMFPIHYIVLPPILLMFAIINHMILIPLVTLFRILLLGFVYVPMLPFLHTFSIDHEFDNNRKMEVTLYRIAVAAYPHFKFFLVNLLHYFVVCAIIGVVFGLATSTWLNLSLLVFDAVTPTDKQKAVKVNQQTQTTPYLLQLMKKIDPVVKVENTSGPLFDFSNDGEDNEQIYEDDDGYDYSIHNSDYYDTNLTNINAIKNEFVDTLKSNFTDLNTLRSDFDVSTLNTDLTIPEEDESDSK